MHTYDKELWAVVWAIKHFRHYLAATTFTVLTDHKPLLNLPHSIKAEGDATGRRGRWALELSTYDFEVVYRKGLDNGNADAMSRQVSRHTDTAVESSGEGDENTIYYTAAAQEEGPQAATSDKSSLTMKSQTKVCGGSRNWTQS